MPFTKSVTKLKARVKMNNTFKYQIDICDGLIATFLLTLIIAISSLMHDFTKPHPTVYKNPNVYSVTTEKPQFKHIGTENVQTEYPITLTKNEIINNDIKTTIKTITVDKKAYNTLKQNHIDIVIYSEKEGISTVNKKNLEAKELKRKPSRITIFLGKLTIVLSILATLAIIGIKLLP